jgi:Cu/Ag efflux pump CusA
MALSSSAGAEVQRPTVVIGGLFTATILMVVLPVLFKVLMENLKDLSLKEK